jgi:hypothetical protein
MNQPSHDETMLELFEARRRIELLEYVIRGLKCGDCWCQMAIGNPMYTSHSSACEQARRALEI